MAHRRLAVVLGTAALVLAACTTTTGTARTAPEPTATLTPAPRPAPTATVDVPVAPADLASSTVVPPVPPVGLTIPALGITVPIDPVGVQADGQMEIPPLAERAGWYRFGAAPGATQGTAVVAAHVDSVASAGLGPFARLGELAVGDVVEVTLEDGTLRRFAVASVTAVPKPDVPWSDVFVRDGSPRLVLVTCGGSFRRDVRSYTDNIIVTADPIGA